MTTAIPSHKDEHIIGIIDDLCKLSVFEIFKINSVQGWNRSWGAITAYAGVFQSVGIGSPVKNEEIKCPTPLKSCCVTPDPFLRVDRARDLSTLTRPLAHGLSWCALQGSIENSYQHKLKLIHKNKHILIFLFKKSQIGHRAIFSF